MSQWFAVEKAEVTHYLFAVSPIISITCDMEKFGFPSLSRAGTFYVKDGGSYVFDKQEWEEKAKEYLQITIDKPEVLQKANNEIKRYSKELFAFGNDLLKKDFASHTDAELADLYDEFERLHNAAHARRAIMWIMETGGEVFSNYLVKYLDSEIKKQKLGLNPDVVFAVLATPLEKNYPAKEKEDFLKLAVELKKETVSDSDLSARLRNHIENYKWLPYGVSGPAWSDGYFVNAMKELLKKDLGGLQQELEKTSQEARNIAKQKQEILAKLKTDEKHLKLLKLAEDSIAVKAASKDALFFGYYAAERLFREIAKRLGIDLKLLRHMLPAEIGPALQGKTVDRKELEDRWELSFHFVERGESRLFVGSEATKFVNSLHWTQEKEVELVGELKGMCARQGYGKGEVKIINGPSEMHKMKQGDVLVSRMTDPEIVLAMKMACAIVTDMGGITCHAAIVSRELGIPCVIGTRFATKVLKDGDLVEVDASKGIVKKL